MMCQCRVINCNKCATLVGMLITEEAVNLCVEAGGIWELGTFASFAVDLKLKK